MKCIEAIENYDRSYAAKQKTVFLAGGITDCGPWQKEVIAMCKNMDDSLILLNPRRENFPINDPSAARIQIEWEYYHLRKADAISFWFPKETLCPIVLYELGSWSRSVKPLFVGMDPEYKRRQDVEIQTELARPEIIIHYSLDDLVRDIKEWRGK